MPYTGVNDSTLPEYILNRPVAIRAAWIEIFNMIFEENGERLAFIVANKWLLRNVKSYEVVARTTKKHIERIEFKIDNSKELIKRTKEGDEYISFILTGDDDDMKYPESLLKKWTKTINEEGIVGDVDHLYYDEVANSNLSLDQMKDLLKNKKGLAKSIKAVYEKGKLWVKAFIDKRYKKLIEKAKGVSLEALIERDDNGNIIDGDLVGFTFGVSDTPAYSGAVIA